MDNQPITLTKEELKSIMEEAVHDAFTRMGIDSTEPLEMQRDFQHLRDWRRSVDAVRNKSMITIIGVLIAGLIGAAWIGFKAAITTGGSP